MRVKRAHWLGLVPLFLFGIWAPRASAILTIEITQGLGGGMPIAIVPFGVSGTGTLPVDVAAVVEADLARSGRFTSLPKKDFLSTPQSPGEINFKDWRLIKADALVFGKVQQLAPGKFQIDFWLYSVFKEKGTASADEDERQLAAFRYVVGADLLRMVGHQIADVVYEKLTGEPGAFNTRIAYVTKESVTRGGVVFKLQIADSDGYNPTTILSSAEPIMSPAWSPDGTRLAYVSFEQKRPILYAQNVIYGSRTKIAEFRGINSAPAWSPDGTRLALVMSKDGNAEIYVMNLADKSMRRLTSHPAIDTEPAWSPDNKHIVFTSDRSGPPQIFRTRADGGTPERITFEGDYNARASYSPDGSQLTLITRARGRYHAATLDLKRSALQVLTDTDLDESPTFAPNGRIILYATAHRGRGVLASVSSDGRVRQLLKLQEGDVREPAWSPFNRQLQLTQGVKQ